MIIKRFMGLHRVENENLVNNKLIIPLRYCRTFHEYNKLLLFSRRHLNRFKQKQMLGRPIVCPKKSFQSLNGVSMINFLRISYHRFIRAKF